MKPIIVILVAFFLFSCAQNGSVITYYDSGKIRTIEKLICPKDSLVEIEVYYESGSLKSSGQMTKGRRSHGERIDYYEDGTIKWQGGFYNGHWLYFKNYDEEFIEDALKHTVIQYENRSFVVGEQSRFRTIIPGIHPSLYSIWVFDEHNEKMVLLEADHDMQYPYNIYIEPHLVSDGYIYMEFVFAMRNGIICPIDSYSVVLGFPVRTDL